MNITILDVEDWERETFDELRDQHDLTLTADSLTTENVPDRSDADIISAFVYSNFVYSDLGAETLDAFDNLKLIATRSTGLARVTFHQQDCKASICKASICKEKPWV